MDDKTRQSQRASLEIFPLLTGTEGLMQASTNGAKIINLFKSLIRNTLLSTAFQREEGRVEIPKSHPRGALRRLLKSTRLVNADGEITLTTQAASSVSLSSPSPSRSSSRTHSFASLSLNPRPGQEHRGARTVSIYVRSTRGLRP